MAEWLSPLYSWIDPRSFVAGMAFMVVLSFAAYFALVFIGGAQHGEDGPQPDRSAQ